MEAGEEENPFCCLLHILERLLTTFLGLWPPSSSSSKPVAQHVLTPSASILTCLFSYKIPMAAFKAHPDNPGQSIDFKLLNLSHMPLSLWPCKVIYSQVLGIKKPVSLGSIPPSPVIPNNICIFYSVFPSRRVICICLCSASLQVFLRTGTICLLIF